MGLNNKNRSQKGYSELLEFQYWILYNRVPDNWIPKRLITGSLDIRVPIDRIPTLWYCTESAKKGSNRVLGMLKHLKIEVPTYDFF